MKALLDSLDDVDENLQLTYEQVFNNFTKVYWPLITKYRIPQMPDREKSYAEAVILGFFQRYGFKGDIRFEDLNPVQKETVVIRVKNACKSKV